MISLILVMVCAIAAGWLANRMRVPYPIVMVIVGIGMGLVYGWPGLELDPHLVLAIVLPAVLYPAAINTSWREFRSMRRPILLLAVGLVTTTTLAIGLAFKWLVPEVPWAVAFALGAIVSPPDAVAAAPTGVFSGWSLLAQFALVAIGGGLLGVALGWLTARVQERLHDPMLELAMSLITPFATYWICETLQLSGVLGIVGAGLYRSRWSHLRAAAVARLNIRTVWSAILFVVNSLVFVLIGIRLPLIATSLMSQQERSWPNVLGLIAALSLVAIGVRFLWIFTATYGVRWLVPSIRRRVAGRGAGAAGRAARRRAIPGARSGDSAHLRDRFRDAGRPGTHAAAIDSRAATRSGYLGRDGSGAGARRYSGCGVVTRSATTC